MKRWIARVAALYPRSWRKEYGDEFDALLDDVKPAWRVFANVLGGAMKMHLTTGSNWLKLVAATVALGAIVAAGASFTEAPRYVSSAAIRVTPQPDPLRRASPQVLRQRATEHVTEMETEILSRTSLSQIIQDSSLDLYKKERRRIPMEDVIEQMRQNIRIETNSSTPIVLSISFAYPDQAKAQAAVSALAAKFTEANATVNRTREMAYRSFWQDEAAFNQAPPAPPPPVGENVTVLDSASLPKKPAGPNRIAFLAWGLGAGLLLGLLAALAMRWPRGFWKLGGFAAAGCILAGTISFLIPNRYTSTASIEITPAGLTEDPLASSPPVTPAAEFLRQMEPQVLSVGSLSSIIRDPRLDLYPKERASRPMEEVVRNMLARDLRITVLNPASGVNGEVSAFSISFSYSDKVKARDAVQKLITTFMGQRETKWRANASRMSEKLNEIHQRKGGENLDVLDPPSLPFSPESPNRLMITAAGLVIGLLLGAISLGFRRPRTPALQPA